ncbi:MAG: ribulose-phosphate 3-epimerase [Eggerthellaceae bacterium]|nr:ribulose-phosphate 3-epimerase [Eggerthellaceae bacterium]
MFEAARISPSLLSADFMNMERDLRLIEEAGVGFVHVDVMDGHFVSNLTMGVPFVKQLKRITALPLDVHLMISNPLVQIPWFLAAGADWLTVHIEALDLEAGEAHKAISLIRQSGAHPSFSLKPKTPLSLVRPYLADLDMVLVMSVEPGFSGQSFIEGSNERIEQLAAWASEANTALLIEIDGGIDASTIEGAVKAGADVIVAGNAIFASPDPAAALKELKARAQAANIKANTKAKASPEAFDRTAGHD